MVKKKNLYGMELILDLAKCDPRILASKKKLIEFVVKLCKLIKMKRYGQPLIEKFGFGADFTAGYSLVQLIETSSITGHFSELWSKAYINIFSCRKYNPKVVKKFTKGFFKARTIKNRLLYR